MSYPYPPLNVDPLAYEPGQAQPFAPPPGGGGSPMGGGMGQAQDSQLQQQQQNPEMQQMTNDNLQGQQQQGEDNGDPQGFERGGRVRDYHSVAKKLKSFGRHGDTILAHINPEEARLLKRRGGAGTSNPKTGLPEYNFFKKITKPFRGIRRTFRKARKVALPLAGAALGNMLVPGVGGLIGGGLGGAIGPEDQKMGMFGGAAMGQLGLAGMNALGGGMTGAGMPGIGGALSKMGGQNYIASLMGGISPGAASMMGPAAALPQFLTPWGAAAGGMGARVGLDAVGQAMTPDQAVNVLDAAAGASAAGNQSFLSQLMTPQNALSIASLIMSHKSRVSPEDQEKARVNAALYHDEMMYQRKRERDAAEQAEQPPEQQQLEHLQVPDQIFNPNPLGYKKGGPIHSEGEELSLLPGRYLDGWTKGKADKIPATIDHHTPALLSDGEYVIPADVVSAVGDWNNKAGAAMFDRMVKRIRKHKGIPERTPKAKNPLTYMMGA